MISTGIRHLDKLIGGLRPGDNVVWQISSGVPIEHFTRHALGTESGRAGNIVYINFNYSPHTVCRRFDEIFHRHNITMIDAFTHGKGNGDSVFLDFYSSRGEYDISRVVRVENPRDIREFIAVMNSVEKTNTSGSFYVFDSLTGMNELWNDERAVADFFSYTCPKLCDLSTIAYWILEREAHTRKFTAELSHITQIVLNVESSYSGQYDLRIMKLEDRPGLHSGIAHPFRIIERDIHFVEQRTDSVRIGRKLRDLRKSRGITQTGLATRLGMTPGAVSQIENDLIAPSLSTLVHISRELKKPVDFFLDGGATDTKTEGYLLFRKAPPDDSDSTHAITPLYDGDSDDVRVYRASLRGGSSIPGPLILHKGRELIALLSGSMELHVRGEIIEMREGDAILIERAFIEALHNVKKSPCDFLHILL